MIQVLRSIWFSHMHCILFVYYSEATRFKDHSTTVNMSPIPDKSVIFDSISWLGITDIWNSVRIRRPDCELLSDCWVIGLVIWIPVRYFFLVSALLPDYSLCWDHVNGTWLLHLTLGRVLIWVCRQIIEFFDASPGWDEEVWCWWETPQSQGRLKPEASNIRRSALGIAT